MYLLVTVAHALASRLSAPFALKSFLNEGVGASFSETHGILILNLPPFWTEVDRRRVDLQNGTADSSQMSDE